MSPLEIILTSVLGGIVLLIITCLIVYRAITRSLKQKVTNFKIFDEFAPKNPIVFLGDSLTDFFPMQEFLHDERVVNRGIANETTLDMLERIDAVKDLKPKTVFLLAGVNDFLHRKAKTPDEVSSRVIKIVEELKTVISDVRIVSLLPVNKRKNVASRYVLRGVTNQKIVNTNLLLKDYCEKVGVEYIDLHSILADGEGNLNKDYTIEGLHLKVEGYGALAPTFKRLLKEI